MAMVRSFTNGRALVTIGFESFRNMCTRGLESISCIQLRFSLIQLSDILAELHRAQDAALNLRNIARDDHLSRAKICSKLIKYPNIADYKVSFAEYERFYFIFRFFIQARSPRTR
jgi:hypothetical protein